MKQRLISIFATLTLLLTLLPVQALAEEAPAESAYAAEETVIEQTPAEEGLLWRKGYLWWKKSL